MNTVSRAMLVVVLLGAVVAFGRLASPNGGVTEVHASPATVFTR